MDRLKTNKNGPKDTFSPSIMLKKASQGVIIILLLSLYHLVQGFFLQLSPKIQLLYL